MKKLYFFLASVLAIVGIGVTHALVASSNGEFYDDASLEAGQTVFIGMRLQNNGQEGNNPYMDYFNGIVDNTNYNYVSGVGNINPEELKVNWAWELVAAETSEPGKWFYIKNCETGRYLSYKQPKQNPFDKDSWPSSGSSWADEDGLINCSVQVQLVDNLAKAKPFLFIRPSEGVELLGDYPTNEDVINLINEVDDVSLMIMAKFEYEDGAIWTALNGVTSAFARLRRYNDWAAYWSVLDAEVVDDPMTEFERFMAEVTVTSYPLGTDPGYVVEQDRVKHYNERMEFLQNTLDEPDLYTEDNWREFLAEVKALLAEAENFTYVPVTPGYYRLVSAFSGFMDYQGIEKAMYSEGGYARWRSLDEGEPEMRPDTIWADENHEDIEVIEWVETGRITGLDQIWQIYEEDGNLYVKNLDTQLYFKNANTLSAAVEMTSTPQWVNFVPLGANADFNLKVENKGYALHTGGHNSGAGEYGNIVGWDGGSGGCSAWRVVPISEDQIKEIWGEDVFTQAALNAEYSELLAEAKAALYRAQNGNKPVCEIIDPVIDYDNKLFSPEDKGSVVTSPCSDSVEGDITYLLDGIIGEADNFWHSDWHGEYNGKWCNGYHYVQFDLGKEYQRLAMYYVPRVRPAGNNNTFEGWPEEFTIYYADDPDAEEWKRGVSFGEGEIDADLHELRENYLPFFIGEATRYVRIVCTKGFSWRNNNKFWMAGELNFCTYEGEVIYDAGTDLFAKANAQGNNVADAFAAAIEHADEVVENNAITAEELAALKAAYEAFMNVFTDFTDINNMIQEATAQLKGVKPGKQPGQKDQEAIDALSAAKTAASEWIIKNKPTCTKAELDVQTKAMKDALDAWYAIPVYTFNTNTWYYLQFASSRQSNTDCDYYEQETELKDSRLAVAYGDEGELETFGGDETSYATAVPAELFETTTPELAQWRFIAIDENTYAIQNRATGNFLPAVDATNYLSNVGLSPMPGKYVVNDLGDGTFEFGTICGQSASGTDVYTYVNQYGNTKMGYWNVSGKSDAGAKWNIVTAEPIATNWEQNVYVGLDGYTVRGLTLPYALDVTNVEGEAVFYNKVTAIDTEAGLVAVEETHEVIPAGTPVLAFSSEQAEGVAPSIVKMAGTTMDYTTKQNGVLYGTMDINETVPEGVALPSKVAKAEGYTDGWGALQVTDEEERVPAGSAWICTTDAEDILKAVGDNDDVLILDQKYGLLDAIAIVKNESGKADVIYNLNGQRVSAPVKGIMIINGKKVVLK